MNYKQLSLIYLEYNTKLTHDLPAEMALSFLIFYDYSVCSVSSIPVENWFNSPKNNYLIRIITNQNILCTVAFYFNFKFKWKQVWMSWTWMPRY